MFNPLVSIIIPVYNGEKYIKDAIDSCLAQTYKNIEILVIDDGSKDLTETICKTYGNKIKYIKKENGGVSTALNIGIKKSRGSYISWLSHDDYYHESKIENQIKAVSKDDKNSIIFSNYYKVNKNKEITSEVNLSKKLKNFKGKTPLLLICGFCINGCSLLIPKKIFEKYGFFNEKLLYTQDYEMWIRLIEEKFIFEDSFVMYSRLSPDQTSSKICDTNTEEDDLWFNFLQSIYESEKLNDFIGYDLSTLYFHQVMKNQLKMVKTNSLIRSKLKKSMNTKQNLDLLKNFYFLINKTTKIDKTIGSLILIKNNVINNGFYDTVKKIFKKIKILIFNIFH
ncbi:MAG: glycosyltransferase [Mycoplasma sp.]